MLLRKTKEEEEMYIYDLYEILEACLLTKMSFEEDYRISEILIQDK